MYRAGAGGPRWASRARRRRAVSFGPPAEVGYPPGLVIVASFSQPITARMLPSRMTPDLLSGMRSLLSGQLGAVPRRLVWDNEARVPHRTALTARMGC